MINTSNSYKKPFFIPNILSISKEIRQKNYKIKIFKQKFVLFTVKEY